MSSYKIANKILLTIAALSVGYVSTALGGELALEEIIVTAQKKLETVQEVPATVNAFTSSMLEDIQARQLNDIEAMTAGLSLSSPTSSTNKISLRGVTFDPFSAASPSVQAYWNEIAVGTEIAFGQLYDVQSIEVLRGPQGTVQGRTSPSGSVQIFTKQPSLSEINGDIEVTFGDRGLFNTQIAVGLPIISDRLALRVSGSYDENDQGNIESRVSGEESNSRSHSGRMSLLWQATDDFSVSIVHQNNEVDKDELTALEGEDLLGHGKPAISPYDRANLVEARDASRARQGVSVMSVDWAIDDYELSSTTGYITTSVDNYGDTDIADILEDQIIPLSIINVAEHFSQELKFSALGMDNWEYLVGLYYEEVDSYTLSGAVNAVNLGVIFFAEADATININQQQFAVFTHHKFIFTDRLNLQVGLRWQESKSHGEGSVYIPMADQTLLFIQEEDEDFSETSVTGTLKLSYDLNEETMIYASLDKGFRPGGATITPTFEVGSENLVYNSESSNSVEFGVKTTGWDNRLQVNAALYYQEISDFISRATGLRWDSTGDGFIMDEDDDVAGGINYNADAAISGAEVDATVLLSEHWLAGFRASYTDATFESGAEMPCNEGEIREGGTIAYCSVEDQRIGSEPNWSLGANTEYSIDFQDFDWFIRILAKYTGKKSNPLVENSNLGGYTVTDMYTGFRDGDGKWDITLWSRNVFDVTARTDVTNNQSLSVIGVFGAPSLYFDSGYRAVQLIDERSVGITGKYYF